MRRLPSFNYYFPWEFEKLMAFLRRLGKKQLPVGGVPVCFFPKPPAKRIH